MTCPTAIHRVALDLQTPHEHPPSFKHNLRIVPEKPVRRVHQQSDLARQPQMNSGGLYKGSATACTRWHPFSFRAQLPQAETRECSPQRRRLWHQCSPTGLSARRSLHVPSGTAATCTIVQPARATLHRAHAAHYKLPHWALWAPRCMLPTQHIVHTAHDAWCTWYTADCLPRPLRMEKFALSTMHTAHTGQTRCAPYTASTLHSARYAR